MHYLATRLTVLEAVVLAQRRILRAQAPDDVAAALVDLVQQLGGTVAPAEGAGPDALPVDLTLGLREATVPVAKGGSPAESTLRAVLPEVVEDARHMVHVLTDLTATIESTDPLTSLPTRERFAAVIERAGPDDWMVGLSLGREQRGMASVGRLAWESALRRLGDVVRGEAHAADRMGVVVPGVIGVLLIHADEAEAESLQRRVLQSWLQPPRPPLDLAAVSMAATPAESALERLAEAIEEGDQADGSRAASKPDGSPLATP